MFYVLCVPWFLHPSWVNAGLNYKCKSVALQENYFRCFELAQLTEGGLGRSKPATNLIKSTVTHCVEYFYYIQAFKSCLPQK